MLLVRAVFSLGKLRGCVVKGEQSACFELGGPNAGRPESPVLHIPALITFIELLLYLSVGILISEEFGPHRARNRSVSVSRDVRVATRPKQLPKPIALAIQKLYRNPPTLNQKCFAARYVLFLFFRDRAEKIMRLNSWFQLPNRKPGVFRDLCQVLSGYRSEPTTPLQVYKCQDSYMVAVEHFTFLLIVV